MCTSDQTIALLMLHIVLVSTTEALFSSVNYNKLVSSRSEVSSVLGSSSENLQFNKKKKSTIVCIHSDC
jgi:hypothetical protein